MKHTIQVLLLSLATMVAACSPTEEPVPVITDTCGDGACGANETADSCPNDCTESCEGDGCNATCGDNVCAPSEDPMTCPSDCDETGARCGDGICDADAEAASCPEDCGTCSDRCDGNELHFCGEGGADESVSCPSDVASACTVGPTGTPYCGCGSLGPGGAACSVSPDYDLVACEQGALQQYICPTGTVCLTESEGTGCYCDNASDGVCPDPGCVDDVDCQTCTPDCAGKTCGDNGCGGSCGSCPTGQTCNDQDQCSRVCTPDCAGKMCGPDGCGGSCGPCAGQESCDAQGQCQAPPPSEDSVEFTIRDADGQTKSVAFDENDAGTFFSCSVDTNGNTMSLEWSNADDLVRIYVEFDPIGFCLFSTSAFDTFTYQTFSGGSLDKSYGVDSLGNSMNLQLACDEDNGRISGTFSTGRLFENRNSSIFSDSWVMLEDGDFDCAL